MYHFLDSTHTANRGCLSVRCNTARELKLTIECTKRTMEDDSEMTKFCHFVISVAGSPSETVVIELETKACPNTCRNFSGLCSSQATAKKGTPIHSQKPTYRGTEFHRIVPKFMVQGGDFTNFDGSGGHALEGGSFKDESFSVSHDQAGILSMANKGPHTNGSQFFITLAAARHLDKKHVAFGRVIDGMSTIIKMAQVETDETNDRPVPMQRIVVMDCGIGKSQQQLELPLSCSKNVDSDDDSPHLRKEEKKKKKKKSSRRDRKKRSIRRRKDDDADSTSMRSNGSLSSSSSVSSLSERRHRRDKAREKKRKKDHTHIRGGRERKRHRKEEKR